MRSSRTADLQRTLRESPDTVTRILEMLTGEPIVADVVRQDPMVAEPDNVLGVSTGHPLIHRVAVLRGGVNGRPYVYAESTFVPDRLPEKAREQLACTSEPIGRILMAHGFAPTRQAFPRPGLPDPAPAVVVDDGGDEVILVRATLLLLGDVPVFAIREWFFGSVLRPFDRSGPA